MWASSAASRSVQARAAVGLLCVYGVTGQRVARRAVWASAAPSPQADGPLAATADVPVGSGVILEEQGVVLTQPTEGDFKAFSSICTHQGCPVTGIDETGISCTCHGSRFSIADGSVVTGPATQPLGEESITVQGDAITLG